MKTKLKYPMGLPFDDECANDTYMDAEHRANIEQYNKYRLLDMLEEAEQQIKELKDVISDLRLLLIKQALKK